MLAILPSARRAQRIGSRRAARDLQADVGVLPLDLGVEQAGDGPGRSGQLAASDGAGYAPDELLVNPVHGPGLADQLASPRVVRAPHGPGQREEVAAHPDPAPLALAAHVG